MCSGFFPARTHRSGASKNRYSILQASSKSSRGSRGGTFSGLRGVRKGSCMALFAMESRLRHIIINIDSINWTHRLCPRKLRIRAVSGGNFPRVRGRQRGDGNGAEGYQDARQSQGRVRGRIAGEQALSVFRQQGRRGGTKRRRGGVSLDG